MNVVDSSGWIEFFVEGPNASFFSEPLAEVDTLLVPTVSILEVSGFVLRRRDEVAALEAVASMRRGYATAQRAGATVWTQDTDFEGLDNVRLVPAGT